MLQLSKDAAQNLAVELSIDDTLCQRDVEGARTFHVQAAPICSEDGLIIGYHPNLYVVGVSGYDGEIHIL
jgi:hypothetical protein